MHKYNNQDHSMYTAMLSVQNIFGADHDVWSVNVEAEYHEEKTDEKAEQKRDETTSTSDGGVSTGGEPGPAAPTR
jgi:hypothetical protein